MSFKLTWFRVKWKSWQKNVSYTILKIYDDVKIS